MLSQLFRCHFSVPPPFFSILVSAPQGCVTLQSHQSGAHRSARSLCLSLPVTDQKGLSPDPTEDLCHLVEEGQVSQGWRGHHSSERHEGTVASQSWQESGPRTPCLPSEGNLRGECALYPERRNTATLVFLRTHTYTHTTHTPTNTTAPHTHTSHTSDTPTSLAGGTLS